jgi:hypothetical protein
MVGTAAANEVQPSGSGVPDNTVLPNFVRVVSLSEIFAIGVGFLYVSGYFINSLFVRNLGIFETELLRLEYIKIGFIFTLITLGIVLLPLGAFYLTYKVRKPSGLPNYHLGAVGNALNTTLCLGFPLFLAFFITKFEFEYVFDGSILGLIKFKSVVITFVILSLTGMIIVPGLERLIAWKTRDAVRTRLYWFIVEPLRFGIFFVTLYLVIKSLSQFAWIGLLASRGFYFFLTDLVFVGGMTAAVLWVRHIKRIKGSWPVYVLICFGLCSLYYMAVASYVYGPYNFIPWNRGGRLPITRAYIEISGSVKPIGEEHVVGNAKLYGPVYIIEDHGDSLFVASEKMERWLYDFVPIHAIRKDQIPYIKIERIEDGFPRPARSQKLK